jgi:hypothetical protein
VTFPHSDEPRSRVRMSDTRYRLLIAGALVAAGVALFVAIQSTNTEEDTPPRVAARPEVVEHLFPPNGDQVLRQTELGIDLASGYEGLLIVNGQPIPEDELRRVPEQNQVFFLPGEGTTFPELPGGTNCVTAVVWKSSEGRGAADQTFRWCFEAA